MFKHIIIIIIFENRKQAIRLLGQRRYNYLLSQSEFEFTDTNKTN